MKWSAEKIYEYYSYQAKDGYGREAIETLAGINKCTETEIEEIIKEEKEKSMSERARLTQEIKDGIIRDYNAGMKIGRLAEKYGYNYKVVTQHIRRWAEKGLLTLREDKPAKPETPAEPAKAAAPVETVIETLTGKSGHGRELSGDIGTAMGRFELLKDFADSVLRPLCDEYKITRVYAHDETGTAELGITLNDVEFTLGLTRVED